MSLFVRELVVTACFDKKIRVFQIDYDQYRSAKIAEEVITEDGITDAFDRLIDYRHPNCLEICETTRKIFVGDSIGYLHIYTYNIPEQHQRYGSNNINTRIIFNLNKQRLIKITSRNQAINQLMLQKKPSQYELMNQNETNKEAFHIYISCRDDSIKKLIQYQSSAFQMEHNFRIQQQFSGHKSQQLYIQSSLSFDGQYLASGSEDGKFYIWDTLLGVPKELENIQVKFGSAVMDCQFNSMYNFMAVCGYGQQFPIIVCGYQRKGSEFNHKYKQNQQKLLNQQMNQYVRYDNLVDR